MNKKPGRSKLNNTTSKTYRWPSDITEYVAEYKIKYGMTETKATIELMRNGILVDLKRIYEEEIPNE